MIPTAAPTGLSLAFVNQWKGKQEIFALIDMVGIDTLDPVSGFRLKLFIMVLLGFGILISYATDPKESS